MSDEIPERDAEDVLRVIRGGGAPRTSESGSRTGEGTFLLTSVHRIAGSEGDDGETRPPRAAIPLKPPPWQRQTSDTARRDASQERGSQRSRAADLRPGPLAPVPGLEDPAAPAQGRRSGLPQADRLTSDPRPDAAPAAPEPDEAMLRRIVADVLDERLAGEFGERITRNLRALVRREVARVLAERVDAGED